MKKVNSKFSLYATADTIWCDRRFNSKNQANKIGSHEVFQNMSDFSFQI
jgi:hypothetical protein